MEFIRISQHLFHSKGLKRQGLTLNEVEAYLLISPSHYRSMVKRSKTMLNADLGTEVYSIDSKGKLTLIVANHDSSD